MNISIGKVNDSAVNCALLANLDRVRQTPCSSLLAILFYFGTAKNTNIYEYS